MGESNINPKADITKSKVLFIPRCMLPMASVCVALLIVIRFLFQSDSKFSENSFLKRVYQM